LDNLNQQDTPQLLQLDKILFEHAIENNPMAREKLEGGINLFCKDTENLESLLSEQLN